MQPILLRLHRWITLVLALPWLVILLTGLVLSFEPMLMDRSFTGKSLPLATVQAAIAKHDPAGKATVLNVRAYDHVLTLQESRSTPPIRVDLKTGNQIASNPWSRSEMLSLARRIHESLLLDLKWLVDASTIALLVSIAIGALMGLPRWRNTISGWHRMAAWGALPLLVLSPLTGLAIAYGVNFTPPPAKLSGPPVKLADAVALVAAKHDLASVYWIRPQGGATRARVYVGGEARVLGVTRDGLIEGPQSWPRVLHEGNWAGVWSGLLNLVVSLVFIGLMATGLWMWWTRRGMRKRASQRAGRPGGARELAMASRSRRG